MRRDSPLKTVAYAGGVTFRIPAHWTEEEDDDGTGIYYGRPERVLRVSVFGCRRDEPGPVGFVEDSVAAAKRRGATVSELAPDRSVAEHEEEGEDPGAGGALHLWFWELAFEAGPTVGQLAIFSFSVPAFETGDAAVRASVDLLRTEIAAARFAPLPPE